MYFDEELFIKQLKEFIKIDSTNGNCGTVSEKAPLGQGVYDALEFILSIGKEMGFKTKMLGRKCAYAECGTGKKLVGIIAHADTVAAGDGWNTPPFECVLKDGVLYGRGVADNKGQALLMLHVMKAAEKAGAARDKRIRLIIGGDEESGVWQCIERYKKTEEIPDMSFTPDGDFPVVNGEKGMLKFRIYKKETGAKEAFSLTGGKVINIVPDAAQLTIGTKTVTVKGKGAHASCPQNGENAILKLADEYAELLEGTDALRLIKLSCKKGLNIDISDEPSGCLTLNPAITKCTEKECYMDYDVRYPVTADGDEVVQRVRRSAEENGFSFKLISHERPLYVPEDSPLVKTLAGVYTKCTGERDTTIIIGGGTYAKAFPNCVAFGASFPSVPDCAHTANEFWSLESVRKCFEIYTAALLKL